MSGIKALRFLTQIAASALATLLFPSVSDARETLTDILSIKQLSYEESKKRRPVRLDGVVLTVSRRDVSVFLHDQNNGIFVKNKTGSKWSETLSVGDRILVEGNYAPGHFSPIVEAKQSPRWARVRCLNPGKQTTQSWFQELPTASY